MIDNDKMGVNYEQLVVNSSNSDLNVLEINRSVLLFVFG